MPDTPAVDPNPYVNLGAGDLTVYGEADSVVRDCLVEDITPIDDLGSEVTLGDYGAPVFTADAGQIGDYEAVQSRSSLEGEAPNQVRSIVTNQSIDYVDRSPLISLEIMWVPSEGVYAEFFEIYSAPADSLTVYPVGGNIPPQASLIASVRGTKYTYLDSVSPQSLSGRGISGKPQGRVFFWVVPISISSRKGQPNMAVWQYTPDTTGPGPVRDLKVSIEGGRIFVNWTAPDDLDISHYEIRGADPGGPGDNWEGAVFIARANHTEGELRAEAPLVWERTYYIRAFDTSRNAGNIVSKLMAGFAPTVLDTNISSYSSYTEFLVSVALGNFPIEKYQIEDLNTGKILAESSSSTIITGVVGRSTTGVRVRAFDTAGGSGYKDFNINVDEGATYEDASSFTYMSDLASYVEFGSPSGPTEDYLVDVSDFDGGGETNLVTRNSFDKVSGQYDVTLRKPQDWADAMQAGSMEDEIRAGALSNNNKTSTTRVVWKLISAYGKIADAYISMQVDVSGIPNYVSFERYVVGARAKYGNPSFLPYDPVRFEFLGDRARMRGVIYAWVVFEFSYKGPYDPTHFIEWEDINPPPPPPAVPVPPPVDFLVQTNPFPFGVSGFEYMRLMADLSGVMTSNAADANGTVYFFQSDLVVNVDNSRNLIYVPEVTPVSGQGYAEVFNSPGNMDNGHFAVKLFDNQGNRITGDVRWRAKGFLASKFSIVWSL